jgi:hypothetical protein
VIIQGVIRKTLTIILTNVKFINRGLKEVNQGYNSMLGANLRVKWFLEAVQIRHICPVAYVDHY